MSSATDLRDLAAWAEVASRWLEGAARGENDADPGQRTVVFDAAALDQILTGFRRMPGLMATVAEQVERLEQRSRLKVIPGGRS